MVSYLADFINTSEGTRAQSYPTLTCTVVNYLVDFVHTSEGTLGQLLKRHHVQHCCHAPLSTTLVERRQLPELFTIAELHLDANPILVVR